MIILLGPFLSGSEDHTMKIQLRISDNWDKEIDPGDLKLFLDKQEIEITGLKMTERYISKERFLGRNFVLSFMNFDRITKVIEDGVSYFVTDILDSSDTLILHTNVDIHQIKVSGNKERMILDILNRLDRDMKYLSGKSSRILKSINTEISKLERYFDSFSPSSLAYTGGATFFQFFATLIPDIQFYKNEFIIPDKKKYTDISDEFGFREGDRYWILIQNGNIYPFTNRIKSLITSVNSQLSLNIAGTDGTWAKMVSNKIRELMEMISIGSQFPSKTMITEFIKSNTSFFTLVYAPEKATNSDKALDIQLEGVLKQICDGTGGKFVETTDIEAGIEGLSGHRDRYWDVSFKVPAGIKKLKLRLTLKGDQKGLTYREIVEEKDLTEYLAHLSSPKMQIEGVEFNDNKLSFSIRSFTLNKRGGFGLLKVVLQLYGDSEDEIFRKSNTLRAGEKTISISTTLPAEFSTFHRLRVSVLDLISNSLAVNEIKQDN